MGKLNIEEEKPTFNHFSHQHPLEITSPCQTGNTTCSGCYMDIVIGEDYYTCKTCTYSLHRTCFMPRIFRHNADPGHELNVLIAPSFKCKACGLQDSGISYSCSVCLVHYHATCLLMQPTTTHSSHPHILKLEFSPPYNNPKAFRCDICGNHGFNHWLYRCNVCGFDVHLNCVTATPDAQSQPQNPANPAFQIPTPAHSDNPNSSHLYHSPVLQPYQNCINHYPPQNSLMQIGRPPTMPANNINSMIMHPSTNTPPGNLSMAYINSSSFMRPAGSFANYQTGCYGFNQGTFARPSGRAVGVPQVNQGFGYPNQHALGSSQGALGAGMTGIIATGVFTGVGNEVGQGITQDAMDTFVNDGSGFSDQNFWN